MPVVVTGQFHAVRNLQAKVATDAAKWQPVLDKVVADQIRRHPTAAGSPLKPTTMPVPNLGGNSGFDNPLPLSLWLGGSF